MKESIWIRKFDCDRIILGIAAVAVVTVLCVKAKVNVREYRFPQFRWELQEDGFSSLLTFREIEPALVGPGIVYLNRARGCFYGSVTSEDGHSSIFIVDTDKKTREVFDDVKTGRRALEERGLDLGNGVYYWSLRNLSDRARIIEKFSH